MSSADIIVTGHAAARWCERVDSSIDPTRAVAAIMVHVRAIEAAVGFGCQIVKLGCGARLILKGEYVVTVLAAKHFPPRLGEWPA